MRVRPVCEAAFFLGCSCAPVRSQDAIFENGRRPRADLRRVSGGEASKAPSSREALTTAQSLPLWFLPRGPAAASERREEEARCRVERARKVGRNLARRASFVRDRVSFLSRRDVRRRHGQTRRRRGGLCDLRL
ncbi:hypothetical protein MRX96_030734 [Rhipicephalus microplus]